MCLNCDGNPVINKICLGWKNKRTIAANSDRQQIHVKNMQFDIGRNGKLKKLIYLPL